MRRLLLFFAATFAFAWTCFFLTGGVDRPSDYALILLGTFAPGIVAVTITAWTTGRPGLSALLAPLFAWRVRAKWYVFAAGYLLTIKLAAALIHRAALGVWPAFGGPSLLLMFGAALLSTLLGGQSGEEIGWRGFALPRLATFLGFAFASLILGLIWAVWHLPLFLIAGTNTTGQSFILYTLQVIAVSVAMTWLYVKSGGSLLLTMLMHAAVNNTKDIVPSADQAAASSFALVGGTAIGWITVVLLWLCALWFLSDLRIHGTAGAPPAFSPATRPC